MGWIPVAPHNLRTSHSIIDWIQFDNGGELYKETYETLLFSNHDIKDGVLISFVEQNDNGDGLIRIISNEIKCSD